MGCFSVVNMSLVWGTGRGAEGVVLFLLREFQGSCASAVVGALVEGTLCVSLHKVHKRLHASHKRDVSLKLESCPV